MSSKEIQVSLPWLSMDSALILMDQIDLNLEMGLRKIQPANFAIAEALLAANKGLVENAFYDVKILALDENSFRLGRLTDYADKNELKRIIGSFARNGIAFELLYDEAHPRAVVPTKLFPWGFRAYSAEGWRNFSWEKVRSISKKARSFMGVEKSPALKITYRGFSGFRKFHVQVLTEPSLLALKRKAPAAEAQTASPAFTR